MKEVADTVGGWMHYIGQVKKGLGRTLDQEECKLVMKCYINSKPISQTVEEMNNVSNG